MKMMKRDGEGNVRQPRPAPSKPRPGNSCRRYRLGGNANLMSCYLPTPFTPFLPTSLLPHLLSPPYIIIKLLGGSANVVDAAAVVVAARKFVPTNAKRMQRRGGGTHEQRIVLLRDKRINAWKFLNSRKMTFFEFIFGKMLPKTACIVYKFVFWI